MTIAKIIKNILSDGSKTFDVHIDTSYAIDNVIQTIVIACDSKRTADELEDYLNALSEGFSIVSIEIE